MALQKNIMNFFKPLPVKRNLSSSENNVSKKQKVDQTENLLENEQETESNVSDDILKQISIITKRFAIVHPNIGETWFKALKIEFEKPYFDKLNKFVSTERKTCTVYPPADKVWTWTHMCPIGKVKVVILGQDPYHNPGQAHGLCFSVSKGIKPPPSLLNMYQELSTDIEGFCSPSHGNLAGWARQGVLLLNACLTVRANSPNSHKDQGWEQLTDAVIKHISDRSQGVVFLLWGAYAQKKAAFVDKKKHHLLKTVHPSPLSAHRGFFGCKHFSQCNKLLKKNGKTPINWADLPED